MFKKRNIKGNTRNKLSKQHSSESESSDEETVIAQKKQKTLKGEVDDSKLTTHDIHSGHESLTKNDSSLKFDSLNQEIIDKDRERKLKEQDNPSIKGASQQYAVHLKPKSSMNMDKMGPKKAASNIRSTTVFDFQRDVCKDYRLTGFCGYGDSCKFLHTRDDFKAGWKLNTDWDLETRNKLENEVKDIPFMCLICKKDYKNPIRTTCNHYFCETCFLVRSKKTLNCVICGENTHGTALPAKNLNALLKKTDKTRKCYSLTPSSRPNL